ncbi:hypothetical protein HZA45_01480 [Candidatus Peregrinibacteria bacterium]|nr:hypothetical protein [Candidatus Peregrinibacteria bacterium]
MIILLAGSTSIVRSAVAEKIVSESDVWRHLAIEDLAETARTNESGQEYDEETLLAIVCQCAKTMQNDGYHMILSLSDVTNLSRMIKSGIEGDSLSLYLGEPDPQAIGEFDQVIDTKTRSINDIYELLRPLIDEPPDA